jgi:protein-tyrosine phosphatase
MGGLGRAPTLAASCLIYSGMIQTDAIEVVKKARNNSLTLDNQINFLKSLIF